MNQGEENCEGGDEVDAGHDQGQGEGDGRHEEGEGDHVEQQATKKSERRDMMLIFAKHILRAPGDQFSLWKIITFEHLDKKFMTPLTPPTMDISLSSVSLVYRRV